MWAGAMFKQIDALPCAKAKLARDHRDRQADRKDRGLDMGRHVIWPLCPVRYPVHALWRNPAEEPGQVGTDIRVGIFLDDQ